VARNTVARGSVARRPAARKTAASPRHREVGLSDDDAREIYRVMVLARVVEERLWILSRQGKAHFVLTSRGHEAAQIGSAMALRLGTDYLFTYYRDLALALAIGFSAEDVFLSVLARASDQMSGGRQLPNHLSSPRLRVVTQSSSVATQIVHAAGAGYAARVLGEDFISIAYFGDGATSKGDFHEAVNLAAIWKLPTIFFCENNGWAISVALSKQMAVPTVAERAAAYGIPGVRIDGTDPFAVYAATREAAERARRGEGPTLIDAEVVRLTPHSSQDDDLYRSKEQLDADKARDPLARLRRYLEEQHLLDEAQDTALWERLRTEVMAAQDRAEAAPLPVAADARKHLFAEF
jgi:2-oxoisovalerate dehydrogenase E1 component alpha subunit